RKRFRHLLPLQHLVTKAGSYGNESPAFLCHPLPHQNAQSLEFKGLSKTGTGSALLLIQK
ncbi:MAG: hypothetical protein R3260_03755, partial [Pseudomonas sp.]|nr:hypothetical protein [Pseudomonas sp.]